ncbi:MAG: DegT/DnrJ/EryC1/StrS family aminotransferase [Candidatus Aminicenantes bacterium]|nr:DegT/DnrJ/EryC1/StrS family aminotransferase [Candidatus Aminicenantes bacterium]
MSENQFTNKKIIPLAKPYFDAAELAAVKQVLDSGWAAGQGPRGRELAQKIKAITNRGYAIPVNNCTAALHLSLLAIGIEPGDEVLVSDYTYPATGHAVMYCGAKPVFVDVSLDTYNILPGLIEKKITGKTKALVINHAFGLMCDMDEIVDITRGHNLKLIEDAACALGACYKERPAGSYGDLAAFSFHARKNVTSGEGGMVVTDSEEYAARIDSLSCFGIESAYKRQDEFSIPVFRALGYNYKLSDINAAVALAQLRKYPRVLEKRSRLAALYNRELANVEFVTPPLAEEGYFHIYQTYAGLLAEGIDRDRLILALRRDGIQTQIGTFASHVQPVYKSKDKCPNSYELFNRSLALPLYYEMEEEQVYFVVRQLNRRIKELNA